MNIWMDRFRKFVCYNYFIVIITILQMRKLRLREVKVLDQVLQETVTHLAFELRLPKSKTHVLKPIILI